MDFIKTAGSIFKGFNRQILGALLLLFTPIQTLMPAIPEAFKFYPRQWSIMRYIPAKTSVVTAEFGICVLAIFLCWIIVEMQRRKCNDALEVAMEINTATRKKIHEFVSEQEFLKRCLELVDHSCKEYNTLLYMIAQHSQKPSSVPQIKYQHYTMPPGSPSESKLPATFTDEVYKKLMEGTPVSASQRGDRVLEIPCPICWKSSPNIYTRLIFVDGKFR